jgi:hypothetical protein
VPALWLTDYVIAENLKAAYESDPAAQTGRTAPITPEVKELISQQVNKELESERNAAANPEEANEEVPAALDTKQLVFVVSMELNVPCRLSAGDVILRSGQGADGNTSLTVLSSKQGNCPVGSNVSVDAATLEEMHNDLRTQIDSGLAVLAENQGKGGLPNGPAADPKAVPEGNQ